MAAYKRCYLVEGIPTTGCVFSLVLLGGNPRSRITDRMATMLLVYMSSHVWPAGATLSHASSEDAMHDRSSGGSMRYVLGSMVPRCIGSVPRWLPAERGCRLIPRWCRGLDWKQSLSGLHPQDGVAESSKGGDIRSERNGTATQIC
jgi:hypothetical protein